MHEFFVISHTHWDREWYLPLESMKLLLCDLMDRCLELLNREPEYIFHLDAQTVVLEDYLEIRPGKKAELEQYIRAGRLVVGPWYLQNDFYLTSGEATVRNLLIGRSIAEAYGNCAAVGYAPDQFGNISQLPQILQGFGIDNFVFARGYEKKLPNGDPAPSEFIWEAPDGSRVMAVFMRSWYNNAQHISADPEKGAILLEHNLQEFADSLTTPYVLLMNGVDHLEPQPDLLPALDALRQRGYAIRQCKLSDYIARLREYFHSFGQPNYCHKGELRCGGDNSLLKGTLSSRYYLKAANACLQTMLENRLEPLYTMLELWGMEGVYSGDHFRYLWKQLLRNHPHDSICGCSCDPVHRHMEDNFARLETSCRDMLRRGMKLAAGHLSMENRAPGNYLVVAANTTQSAMDAVLEVCIDIPKTDKAQGIRITDNAGHPVPFFVHSREEAVRDGFSPMNLPGVIPVDRFWISMQTGRVEPFAFKGFLVEPTEEMAALTPKEAAPVTDIAVLENAHLQVTVYADGRADLLDKQTGCRHGDFLDLEDTADRGDSYVHIPLAGEKAILASDFPASVTWERCDPLVQEIAVRRRMRIPECFDFDSGSRSEKLLEVPVCVKLRLTAAARQLEVVTEIDNPCKDHRMRLLVRTQIDASTSHADIPYDILSHTVRDHPAETWSKVLPNTTFVALEEDGEGLAVFTEGAHEYEHAEADRTLAFTLLRATGVIARDYETLQQSGGDVWLCPENQCLRKMRGRFGVFPYGGTWLDADVPVRSVQFRTGISSLYTACDEHRFMQGRPAVQDSRLEEYFFYPDPYQNTKIRDNHAALTVEGKGIAVTALKMAETGSGIILRTVNLSSAAEACHVTVPGILREVSLDESRVLSHAPDTLAAAKKITTYHIKKEKP